MAMSEAAASWAGRRGARGASPWLFFIVVFAWSWSFWIAAAVLGLSARTLSGQGLELAGLLGPMLGGIAFTYLTQGSQGRRDYWRRIVDARRISASWYAVILLFAPVLWGLAALVDMATGNAVALSQIGHAMSSAVATPASALSLLLWTLLFGPIPEELGWRGYALDSLQAGSTALRASLILGAIWGLYHLPLFYLVGTYHAAQGPWSLWFWLFLVQVIPVTIVFTWIFNNTRRSTLAAILLHFTINLTAQLANLTGRTNIIVTALWLVAAVVVVVLFGPATLRRARS